MTDALPKHFPQRWRLSRAGIVNVWHYLENTFDLSGGRMILRGTNGAGKSRALEMLLPFLLDADRRKMDATGSGRVNLDELMRVGADAQTNRTGYLWLELTNTADYLTIGAHIRHGRTAKNTQVWYFITPHRVGDDLALLNDHREPLGRDALAELIGPQAITDSAETHRERVRTTVFGLHGESGRDRYAGLLQLLHTLRAPDVGNRIDEGRLPQILSAALPPLEEQTVQRAGEQLDGLTTLRQAQQRLEESHDHVASFLGIYRRYAAATVLDTAAQTLAAVAELATATRAADQRAAQADGLRVEHTAAQAEAERCQDAVDELRNAITAIRTRDIFKQADDLVQRDKVVTTLATAADNALGEAVRERDNHDRAVEGVDERANELADSAEAAATGLARARDTLRTAHLPDADVPEQLRIVEEPAEPEYASRRISREADPQPVARSIPRRITVRPADLDAVADAVHAGVAAADTRRELARRRQQEARRLSGVEAQVRQLEGDAVAAATQAEQDAAQAADDAQARDDHAIALAGAWHEWTAAGATTELLGALDWSGDPHVGPLLHDVAALCGDADLELAALDTTAERHARPALDRIAAAQADLDREQQTDAARRAELQTEASALRRAEDPAPAEPPWLDPARAGVPLWRAVDFVEDLGEDDRAGLEAALLAAGLLTARIEADGALRADDGATLISPADRPADRAVTAVMRPDPAGPVDGELVARILAGIGLADDSATAVSPDGSWRHGSLRGRHTVSAARHIGATARERARRQRLADIDQELGELDARAAQRRVRRGELDARAGRIQTHVRVAPRSADLHQARGIAAKSTERAARSAVQARAATERATSARAAWAGEVETHRSACELLGLPTGADELAVAVAAAGEAAAACGAAAAAVRHVGTRRLAYARSVARADEQAQRRDAAEQRADESWRAWHSLAAEVAALHQAIDLTVEQARAELDRSEKAHAQALAAAKQAQARIAELAAAAAAAQADARHAAALAGQRRDELVDAAQQFNDRASLPGLLPAATDAAIPLIDRPELSGSVEPVVRAVVAQVRRPAQPADENTVLRAFQTFDREVSGQLDVTHTIEHGVAVITVHGAGDEHTLPGAAAALAARVATGRSALTEREREVFTTFVLGGVAEELRRRINQASALVDAMNASLRTLRTSNGIGVRLSWHLSDDTPALKRIAALVRTADAVRSPAQSSELTELLRQRVDESYAADPSSGYAAHLAAALDYRRWHEVAVTILGPNPEQERRLSSRAKLSQGETRFVSYVTLFAAADGYLSGLSDDERQLRLILLDDAFAKVDDPTIADLMGLLVRLDLDFVMTGHALWGCFPQVPKLDVYDVRRQQGTSAVTTHVHWDGHTRHLRSTG